MAHLLQALRTGAEIRALAEVLAWVLDTTKVALACDLIGKNLLNRSVPFLASGSGSDRIGSLIRSVDITKLKLAQRERDDVVRFLSHDLKSPASSLLGIAQLQRDATPALANAQLADRLDDLAQ